MADVNRGNRPLSPFMIGPYYKPQITSISSIMVRITGIACLGLSVLVIGWLLAAATSETAFDAVNGLFTSILGDLVFFAACWALWYHVLGRLRHVIWDFEYAFEIGISEKMGWAMFIGASILAVLTAIVLNLF